MTLQEVQSYAPGAAKQLFHPTGCCQKGAVVSSFDKEEAEILGKLVISNYYLGYN